MRIGIDFGGTKIAGLALGPDGLARAQARVATPRGDYDACVRAVRDMVAGLEAACGARASVGVGVPGGVDRVSGRIKNANSTWLNGRPFDRDLAQALARPVRLANDANCFALSEAIDGAGAGAEVVFGVILGTGVGGGVVVRERLLEGPNGLAGEWGHNPLPWARDEEIPGPSCFCGKRGCNEAWLSGPGLAADHERATGAPMAAHEIAQAAARGDAAAQASLARHGERLARALAGVVNLLDPDVVVLGGGVSEMDHIYDAVPRHWRRHQFSATGGAPVEPRTRLARAAHGPASGVRGAAWLWRAEERI